MKKGGRCRRKPIQTIQIPSVTRNGVARIFHANIPFDARGNGIPHKPSDRDTKPRERRFPNSQWRQKAQAYCQQRCGQDASDESLPSFIGTDSFRRARGHITSASLTTSPNSFKTAPPFVVILCERAIMPSNAFKIMRSNKHSTTIKYQAVWSCP
jgi:hypothetical protein